MLASIFLTALTSFSALAAALPTSHTGEVEKRASLPSTFTWSSRGPLISPRDNRGIAAYKDPSIVFYNGKYHLFVSTASSSGYNLAYLSFTDFNTAGSAQFTYLDTTAIGKGYRAAPQIFYFAPQKLWYLIFQNGNAGYSTDSDITNPKGWRSVKNFFSGVPDIVKQNIGNGNWLDFSLICDSANCHMFSSDDNGHLYRAQTSIKNFPHGWGNIVIVLSDSNKNALFGVSNVYSTGDGKYLLLVQAIGSKSRYFRSWTSSNIAGPWTTLAATESQPFAGTNNVRFSGSAWSSSISHGDMIRSGYDQNMAIDPCKLRYFYQGLAPGATGNYDLLPWKLGLLTETNSAC